MANPRRHARTVSGATPTHRAVSSLAPPPAADNNACASSDSVDSKTGEAEILHELYLGDPSNVTPATIEYQAQQRRDIEASIDSCMSASGFNYTSRSYSDTHFATPQNPDLSIEEAQEKGFGISVDPSGGGQQHDNNNGLDSDLQDWSEAFRKVGKLYRSLRSIGRCDGVQCRR